MERKNNFKQKRRFKKLKRRLIISDFDDTLFFTDKSMALATKEIAGKELHGQEFRELDSGQKRRIFITAFRKYKEGLYPNEKLIQKYKELHDSGYELIIMSARGEELRPETQHGIETHRIPAGRIVLADGRYKTSDREWKFGMLKELIEGYDEVLFFDDLIENIAYIQERFNGPKMRYFLVSKEGEKELTAN